MNNDKALSEGVARLVAAEQDVENAEALLGKAKSHLHMLKTKELVELFDNSDTIEHEIGSGAKAKKGMWIEGSLPKESEKKTDAENAELRIRREAAITWASGAGYDPNIKSTIKVEFDKGDRDKAVALAGELQRTNNAAVVTLTEDIHHSTLKAIVRQRLREGKPTPVETLGITALPAVTLVKRPKEKLI